MFCTLYDCFNLQSPHTCASKYIKLCICSLAPRMCASKYTQLCASIAARTVRQSKHPSLLKLKKQITLLCVASAETCTIVFVLDSFNFHFLHNILQVSFRAKSCLKTCPDSFLLNLLFYNLGVLTLECIVTAWQVSLPAGSCPGGGPMLCRPCPARTHRQVRLH